MLNTDKKPQQGFKIIDRFRVTGMAFGGIPHVFVFIENQAPVHYWVWLFFCCVLWPHVARWHTHSSAKPRKAQRYNLMFDSFVAGSLMPLIEFNLLPTVLTLTIVFGDSISSTARNLWYYSLPLVLLGVLSVGLTTGFAVNVDSSMTVIIACLPLLIVHTLSVSWGNYQMISHIRAKNAELNKLSMMDVLTNLYNKRYWESAVETEFEAFRHDAKTRVIMVIDCDNFKKINDTYGHLAGDKVLKHLGNILSEIQDVSAITARLGGDEFAVLMETNLDNAKKIAYEVKTTMISSCDYRDLGGGCSLSIGLSCFEASDQSFTDCFERADKNLYKDKKSGRG